MHLQHLTAALGLLASTASCARLYVSDYSGTVTTLELSAGRNGSYALTTTAVTNDTAPQPSWLEKVGDVIYLADENFNGPNGTIAAYRQSASGNLTLFDSQLTANGPVSLVPYNKGRGLAAACYSGSALTSFAINPKTSTLSPLQTFPFTLPGPGTIPDRQDAPHPHEVILDPTDSFILSPDLGADLVHIFRINRNDSTLSQRTPYAVPPGTGPRHGTFLKTANATYFFLIAELSNTLVSYKVDYRGGELGLTPVGNYTSFGPKTTPAGAASAEAILSPDHRFLLTSVRNITLFDLPNFDPANSTLIPSDSLQSWRIDHATGRLTFAQLAPAGGSYPRQFSINARGNLVAVGLQNDGRVAIMKRDVRSGRLGAFVGAVDIEGQITSVIWDD